MSQNEIVAKKCPIIINNGAVIVVKFDHINVQLPYFYTADKYLYVTYENGKYSVINEMRYKDLIEKKAHVNKKKNVISTPVIGEGVEHVILESI